MATGVDQQEYVDSFDEFFREYYRDAIGTLARNYPSEQKSLLVDWDDLYRFDRDLADEYLTQPEQLQRCAEEALRVYDLPIDVSLGQAHVRIHNIPEATDIRELRAEHVNDLVAVKGIVRKATDVRPKCENAAFRCVRCETLTRVPQDGGSFQEPHECRSCERQGPFQLSEDQSEFVDAQRLRVQESPEGLRGGETPQAIDIDIEDDITGEVTPGDHVTATGILRLDQDGGGEDSSPIFDVHMEGVSVVVDDEEFEDMDITEEDKETIVELAGRDDVYEQMIGAIAPSIHGYDQEKLAMTLQLFSGVTKHLPDESRIRGDLHILFIGDPGTGKSQLLQYVRNIAPRSVYTSGKGSSSAGLTAAAVRDDFGDGQQWTLEAGALVLADQGVAAVDELDKMRCVTGDTLVHLGDGRISRIQDLALEAADDGVIEDLENGRTIRDVDLTAWTMTDDGRLVQRPVTAIHEYEAPADLTEVQLESGETLTATPDHPYFVFEDGRRVERPANELSAGDWVYVPRHVPSAATDGGAVAEGSDAPAALDAEAAALGAVLGYLSGDGNVYYDREEGVYGIRFVNSEPELLCDFERACRAAFGAEPYRAESERREDGVQTVRLSGKAYADRVLEAGMTLGTYDEKAFPDGVTEANRAAKAAFVRALADSEANVDTHTGNVRITSASYDLLLGTKEVLLEFGVSSQIQHTPRDGKRDIYQLAITDADSLHAFCRHVGFTLERKHTALETVCDEADGDRTILDVVPEVGDLLEQCRESLRLYQSECGLDDATYCEFENEVANVSIHRARRILEAFEQRKQVARDDATLLEDSPSWDALFELKERYHVTQSELAQGSDYYQQQISLDWGTNDDLRAVVQKRLQAIVSDVANADLSELRSLVEADVKWRRVESVQTVPSDATDGRIEVLRNELAGLLQCDPTEATAVGRRLLDRVPDTESWDSLRRELERYGVSFQEIADDLDVAGSTVSRWFNGVVSTDRFEEVRSAALSRFESVESKIAAIVDEIEERKSTRVYDLTVEGTHNFVANGMVVHNSEDRSAMHEALEQQSISISKAGINATLKSRCSLLGAANPIHGRFDQYEPMGEQIDLEPALISRFDLIFTVTDEPDPEDDAELAEHILEANYAGQLNTQRQQMSAPDVTEDEVKAAQSTVEPTIEPELLRKYVAYSQQSCYPRMTDDAREAIRDFYVELRSKGADEDAPVPVTARKLEALVRLAEASARVRLADEVRVEDAERVIEIVRSCLQDIGVDPETGEFDADIIETGTSKTQRDRIKNLKALIDDMAEEFEEGVPVDQLLDRADDVGIGSDKAERELEKLKQKGEVYEPRTDHVRTT